MYSNADIVTDVSPMLEEEKIDDNNTEQDLFSSDQCNEQQQERTIGKLWVGFSMYKKEEVHKLEDGGSEFKKQLFQKLVSFREQLISRYRHKLY
ncbi:MAG: hypothetical protein WA941_17345 [Nitrososphaeraceae archaeon]